jgi:AhpC/TSA family
VQDRLRDRDLAGGIPERQVGIRADGHGSLARIQPVDLGGVRGGEGDEARQVDAAADYSKFQELNVQILGISADNPFAQQTFADSLKLPYPLLSDFPDRKVIRSYGILGASEMTAERSFFLVDEQGIVRQQWLLGPAGGNMVMPSEPILKAVQEIKGKP